MDFKFDARFWGQSGHAYIQTVKAMDFKFSTAMTDWTYDTLNFFVRKGAWPWSRDRQKSLGRDMH